MKPFLIACAAAILIAIVGGVVLESVQVPADKAHSSSAARV